jgi:site-specific recombinase XerD
MATNTAGLRRGYPGMKPPNAGKRYPPEPLTKDEAIALLNACGRGPTGIRNRAIIAALWRGGLRVGECVALYPRDVVQVPEPALRVRQGKTPRSARLASIDPWGMALVQLWLIERRKLKLDGRHALFCNVDVRVRGRAMYPQAVRQMLAYRARRAGIEKRCNPHALRHTHAFELSLEGVPVNVIQGQLGHASLGVTSRYIDHLAPAARLAILSARPAPIDTGGLSP